MANRTLWQRLTFAAASPAPVATGLTVNGTPIVSLAQLAAIGFVTGKTVTRTQAISVPAVMNARNRLIAAVSGMPLQAFERGNNDRVKSSFLDTPDPQRTYANLMTDTVEDLFFDRYSYWHATRFEGNYPAEAQHVKADRIGVKDGKWTLDGAGKENREIIQFEGTAPGILQDDNAKVIRDAINLERAAGLFSDSPLPLGYFTTTGNTTPSETAILKFLSDFTAARRAGAYGFIPGTLKLETPSLDAEKIQLAQSREHATLEIARATTNDPTTLGISTTSRTYFNATQVRQDDLDFHISLYTRPIEQRLSMPSVTPADEVVRFNFDEFLRTDPLTRAQVAEIGLRTGRYADADEVRADEGLPPLTPAQKSSRAQATQPATNPGAKKAPVSEKSGGTP